jgi:hypothetical protein
MIISLSYSNLDIASFIKAFYVVEAGSVYLLKLEIYLLYFNSLLEQS